MHSVHAPLLQKKTTTAITQCKLQYYIHHMHVHTTTTITTAQLRDNACIQYMRQCFGKKTTSTSISHSASYNITCNHHHYHHYHHSTNYNACIQYMRHCFRKTNRPPVQVTVGLVRHQHLSDHRLCQGVHAHSGGS